MEAPAPSPPARQRPGRWKRRLLWGFGILVALVACAPFYLGPLLRRVLVGQLEQRLAAHASVQEVSFSWPARLTVRQLALKDLGGAPLASLDELRASLELLALVRGEVRAEVELTYPELHVSRSAAGPWNWEPVLAPTLAQDSAPDEEADGEDEPLPALAARVRVADGHVLIHGPQGDTAFSDIELEITVTDLGANAPFRLALGVRGPGGPAGRVALEGGVTLAPGGRIEPETLSGEFALELSALELAGFAPALALLAPAEALTGTLSGRSALRLAAGLELTGETDVVLSEFALRGPLASEPTRIERVELHGRASQQGAGTGTQEFELRAGSFLTLAYQGRSALPAQGAGELAGTLRLTAELAPLAELARGWVPLQAGVSVEGRLEHTLELALALAERAPRTAHLRARGGVTGLSARDASARVLDLGALEPIAIELEARHDFLSGTLSVPLLELKAGPLALTGRALEAAGLALDEEARRPELRGGALALEADLEALRSTLAQLVALDGAPFGGKLSASSTLRGEDGALSFDARIVGRSLAFSGVSLASLDGELSGRRAADGALAGTGTVRAGALTLTLAGQEPLALPGSTTQLTLQESAAGKGEHVLGFKSDDGALELGLQARSSRDPSGALELRTAFKLDGRIARLAALAAPLTPLRAGLGGDLRLQGDLTTSLAGSELLRSGGRLELFLTGLSASDAEGRPLPLAALAQTTLSCEAEFDGRAGVAELRTFALNAGGLVVRGSGRATGLGARGEPGLEDGRLDIEADLARLGGDLGQALEFPWTFTGSPLRADVRLSASAGRVDARGSLAADELRLTPAEGAPLEQRELALEFDVGLDTGLGSLHVRRARARSRTAQLDLSGTLNELGDLTRTRGAMQLELGGELERMLGDFGLEPPEAGRRTSGTLSGKFALDGDSGAFQLTGKGSIERFRLELAPASEGASPVVIEEPSIALECATRVTPLASADKPAGFGLQIDKLTLASGLARGGARGRVLGLGAAPGEALRFEGLTGELAYVPDRLGVVLAPWLPGKLSGAEEQRLTFTLNGALREFDLASLLASAETRIDLGLGRFERPEIDLGGALVLETKEGKAVLRADLTANGGRLQLDGTLDLSREKPRSRLTVVAKEVRANSGLAPLLALAHPAFGGAQLTQGHLDGLIGLQLDLSYDGPLTLEQLEAGWETLPKQPINGTGSLELRSASLRGSPLLDLLEQFGVDAGKALDLRPLKFVVQRGRVTYAEPWTWTLSGTPTTFTGSLGLDQSLDLAWNVPVTDALIQRWDFLSSLKGENLAIPLRGSVLAPRLEADGLLKDLAAKAAKKELEGRLGLGGGSEDPAALLKRADELWGKGQKSEAATLYNRLKDDFKLSLTYALNKDRIRERAKYTPPK